MVQKKMELIENIEKERESRVLCYITGDRENLSTRIAPDIMQVFFRHLQSIQEANKIDLFLYTRGGDVLTPWRLVNLIREHTPYFSTLIPFRAYSAGTLICLGADEIVMGKMGELGPIDPSVANAFNPDDPHNPQAKVPVSVEDVVSYLSLAKSRAKLDDPQYLYGVFSHLTEKVHPLALGNVHRNYSLIRLLAKNLLQLHIHTPQAREQLVPEIIDYLTEQLYAHNYMIPRQEAKEEIALNVLYPDSQLEAMMWELYLCYEDELSLLDPFDASEYMQGLNQEVEFEVPGGFIETLDNTDAFVFKGLASPSDTGGEMNIKIQRQTWRRIR